MTRTRQIPVVIGLFLLASVGRTAETPAPAGTALDWLRSMTGTWKAHAQWTGGRTESYDMTAVYSVTGNGTAVVEDLGKDGVTSMTSVYHQDGTDLRMTHYCGVGNQPRLKATSIDTSTKSVRFEMTDITGRQGPHVGAVALRFIDHDHATLAFTFVGGKTPSIETIDLTRNGR